MSEWDYTGQRHLLICLLVPVGYMTAGWAGLLLAVPPGYASPVFLPAGIAITACLIAGPIVLPSIFLGSIMLNALVGYSHPQISLAAGLASSLAIAAASTLQAALGGVMLRKLVGYPAWLDTLPRILAYQAAAPLICLMSASLSVGSLWLLHVVSSWAAPNNWLHWWAGDWLGLLLGLPLMLMLCGDPRQLWRHRAAPLGLLAVACLGAFAAAFWISPTWLVIALAVLSTAGLETLLLFLTGRSFAGLETGRDS